MEAVGGPADKAIEPTLHADGADTQDTPPAVIHRGEPGALPDGELVAGRYRVVKLLARGGMGEVYQAEDQELREMVALKIMRPEIANDRRTAKRFRREVQLARKVTHSNVCRCFDVGTHTAAGKPPITFMTMELLLGETLTSRVARRPFATDEALPLVRQLTAALDASHRVGIVHRDFKSDNVVLVPAGAGQPPRAVVTDFGVARALVGPPRRSSSLTAAGVKVGTPAYMAPEQVEGGPPTTATDLYALGVVMYEMVTGALPFVGETRFETAMKRVHEPAPSPRVHREDLDPTWERVILRCLERAPRARFASALEILAALEGKPAPPPPAPPRRGAWLLAGAVLVAAALAAAAALVVRALR
jgi:eukaryotic-like serine/threonine-protein kinase